MPYINEVSVEFDPGHRRHMDVGDQAGRFGETGDARKSAADGKASTV